MLTYTYIHQYVETHAYTYIHKHMNTYVHACAQTCTRRGPPLPAKPDLASSDTRPSRGNKTPRPGALQNTLQRLGRF